MQSSGHDPSASHHEARPRGLAVVLTVALAAGLSLAGCAGTTPEAAETAAAEGLARDRVAELARDVGSERPDDIDGWARAVVSAAATASGESAAVELIGIDALQSIDVNEPFGSLDLRVRRPDLPDGSGETPVAFCFRVAFDYYGKVGDWETSDGVDSIQCPPGVEPVIPPPDETVAEVVSVNAREVAREVLVERAAGGGSTDADDVAAAIAARLEQPTEPFRVAAPPRVVVVAHDRVGVAMGMADDCVLLKLEGGVVVDLYPPPILLQPGELGCSPETALADDEQLRSPH